MEFSALRFPEKDLFKALHTNELESQNKVFVHIASSAPPPAARTPVRNTV